MKNQNKARFGGVMINKNHVSWLLYHSAFTLIELLVVVLIIGILVAIAVPQYEKSVEKARATQALTLLKALANAQEVYYFANGKYATSFDELAIEIPFLGNTQFLTNPADTKSNQEWAVELQSSGQYINIQVARISGKYQGSGFVYIFSSGSNAPKKQILCFERTSGANFLFDTTLSNGAYCQQIMAGTQTVGTNGRYYTLS